MVMCLYYVSGRFLALQQCYRGMEYFKAPVNVIAVEFTKSLYLENLDISSLSASMPIHVSGWVGMKFCKFDVRMSSAGVLLNVIGKCSFHIIPSGQGIIKIDGQHIYETEKEDDLSPFDREILLGPVLVLALSMQGTWCLHGSAVVFNDKVIVFLGESGFGKSTLAAYLSKQANWQLLADDILPVTLEASGLVGWPHFPQLKLPADAQPGLNWPEQVPISAICLLHPVDAGDQPKIQLLPGLKAIQSLLSHTAGTRLFGETLLEKHLVFCAQAAEHIPVYQLSYPHSKDALPQVKDLLENLC